MFKESMENSLYHLLLKNEKEFANRVYLKQPRNGVWHNYTWAEVMTQARQVAAFLKKQGLKKGAHVSIISKNCAEWFITDFGIHLAGMVNVALFTNQHEESIHFVLNHAGVKLVFVGKLDDHQQTRGYIPKEYPTVSFDYHDDLKVDHHWSDVLAMEPLMDLKEPGPDDLYTIIYSSGTTGDPKGATYTNQIIANYLSIFPEDFKRLQNLKHYKLVSYLPLAHVYERTAGELASITINCDVSFVESLDLFAHNLQHIKPTMFTAVPRIWTVFQQKIKEKLPPTLMNILLKIPYVSKLIKHKVQAGIGLEEGTNFVSGASSLPVPTMHFFEKLGIRIQEGYGQTENLAYATLSMLPTRRLGYVGSARTYVEIKLSKDGELLIKSPCLMSGYYKNPKATEDSFVDGWLRTGDLAEIDDKGRVKILGRVSENFKNETGEFVAPSPIEKQFESNGYIEQLCLVGRDMPHNVMLVTVSEENRKNKKQEDITKSLADRMQHVNKNLVKYEKISHVIVVKDLWSTTNDMMTPTLKVKRKKIEAYYADLVKNALQQKNQQVIWEK